MKRKVLTDIRAMDVAALQKKAQELTRQIEEERLNMQTKEVKNRRAGKVLRNTRSVVLTVLREKQLIAG